MSIATMAARTHAMTPQDELIGSMTRERVSLLARYAGGHRFLEDGTPARLWLAHALETDVPYKEFDRLCHAANTAVMIEECDLELWYDTPNTDADRARLQADADDIFTNCVEALTTVLCAQLGVTA